MKKIKIIHQMEHSECGLACIAMISCYYNRPVSLITLREKYGIPNGGYNLSNLKSILSDLGIDSYGTKLFDIKTLRKKYFPFIAVNKKNHYFIVTKFKNNKVTIYDPANGKHKIQYEEFENMFAGISLFCHQPENIKEEKSIKLDIEQIKNKYSLLTGIVKTSRYDIFKFILFSIMLQLTSLLVPFISEKLVDNIVLNMTHNIINIIGISVLIIYLLYYVINVTRGLIVNKVQKKWDLNLMNSILKHMLKLPYKFFTNRSTGALTYMLNSNVYIRQILTQSLITTCIDFVLIFIYVFIMIKYSAPLTIVVFILSGIMISMSLFNTSKLKDISRKEITQQSRVQSTLNEVVSNISTIKSIGLENVYLNKWSEDFTKQIDIGYNKGKYIAVFSNIISSIEFILTLFILWLGSYSVIQGNLSIGMLVAFSSIAASFVRPIISVCSSYTDLIILKNYLDRLYDLLDSEIETDNEEEINITAGKIYVDNVNFKYSQFDDNVLNNITFNINPGEKVAIVGKSGSGKSTLLKLLLGLYSPESGDIHIDNIDLSNININNYRKQIGVVTQSIELFNGTIKENILAGREVSDFDIYKAINKSGLSNIFNKSTSLDTIISEDGKNFSGGQLQRFSLARALIGEPKILLLDEPTSSLDNQAEQAFMKHIFDMDVTAIVVSHRLSTIQEFDKIIVMENSNIVEIGTYDELMMNKSSFYKLYNGNVA